MAGKKTSTKTESTKGKSSSSKGKRGLEFKVGDHIVYPFHGVGTIIKIETRNIAGNEEKYYNIYIESQDMTAMVPVNRTHILKVRGLVSNNMLNRALKLLKTPNEEAEIDWKIRLSENTEKLKSGEILKVAEVARDLHQRERSTGLSSGDKRIYRTAKLLLVEETAAIKGISRAESQKLIEANLREVEPDNPLEDYSSSETEE